MFFYGPQLNEEVNVEIESGKLLILKLLTVGDAQEDGHRNIFFELNGQQREASVRDKSLKNVVEHRRKADANNPLQIGVPMPGMIVEVAIRVGDEVKKGAKLLSLEAMKMQTTMYARGTARSPK